MHIFNFFFSYLHACFTNFTSYNFSALVITSYPLSTGRRVIIRGGGDQIRRGNSAFVRNVIYDRAAEFRRKDRQCAVASVERATTFGAGCFITLKANRCQNDNFIRRRSNTPQTVVSVCSPIRTREFTYFWNTFSR